MHQIVCPVKGKTMKEYMPIDEGEDHINIYSGSGLALGRQLSNFYRTEIEHPEYGTFNSVEGFYFWLLSGKENDILRELHGYEAKQTGTSFNTVVDSNSPEFKIEVQTMIILKLSQNRRIQKGLIESSLPFTHYYYYGSIDNPKVHRLPQHDYMVDIISQYRDNLKSR